jgi:hypothetical protein
MPTSLTLLLRKYWLPLLIALAINAVVTVNFFAHHPGVGYDIDEHLHYAAVMPNRLPTQEDTYEFFSPPLPYLLPSIFDKSNRSWHLARGNALDEETRYRQMGRFGQAVNIPLSIGITLLLWQITSLLRPGSVTLKISVLALLALMTVYFRTFSQPRGEPYVAFSICLVALLLLLTLRRLPAVGWKDGGVLGAALGLLIISRQWGFFIFPALALLAVTVWLRMPESRAGLVKVMLASAAAAFLVGGWFYIYLFANYGRITAFNMEAQGFHLSNQPASFYETTGLNRLLLFRHPVRPVFDNTLLPIFYADTWGDYWCYFSCIRPETPPWEDNRQQIGAYLGRVNFASTLPAMILLGGFGLGGLALVRALMGGTLPPERLFAGFLFNAVLFSILGYLWFLISYPTNGTGSTNKATYMIQIFMLLPLLGGLLLEKIRLHRAGLYAFILAALAVVFLHNLPAMITRYWRF